MSDWEREHPKVTARFTVQERDLVQAALDDRGMTARDALLAWAAHAELDADTQRLAAERGDLASEVERLREKAATLEADLETRRADAEAKLRSALQSLRRDAEAARVEAARLGEEVDRLTQARDSAMEALIAAGVAPDDPALGVALAVAMLRPVVEAVGRDAIAEAFSFLAAAAVSLRGTDEPPSADVIALSLIHRLDRAEAMARAQVAGAVFGQRIASQLARLPVIDAEATWHALLETGRVPEAWLAVAADAVRRTGLDIAPEAIGEFVRACVYVLTGLVRQAAADAPRPAGSRQNETQADAVARLRALVGLPSSR